MNGFIEISKYAGYRPDLVQAGGGNSSFKINESEMLVKSSGYRLSEIDENNGYTRVNLKLLKEKILANYKNNNYNFETLLKESVLDGKKPSIETFIHAITKKYTLHTHPTAINIVMIQNNYNEILESVCSGFEFATIDYEKPGIEIAKKIIDCSILNNKIEIIFMKNHGIIISSNDYKDVIDTYENILNLIEKKICFDGMKYHNITMISRILKDKFIYLFNKKIGCIDDFKYEYCPDNIVYVGEKIYCIKKLSEIDNIANKDLIKTIYFDNYLYIIANSYKKAKEVEEILNNILEINYYCDENKIVLLSKDEIRDLLLRKDEKYRQNL